MPSRPSPLPPRSPGSSSPFGLCSCAPSSRKQPLTAVPGTCTVHWCRRCPLVVLLAPVRTFLPSPGVRALSRLSLGARFKEQAWLLCCAPRSSGALSWGRPDGGQACIPALLQQLLPCLTICSPAFVITFFLKIKGQPHTCRGDSCYPEHVTEARQQDLGPRRGASTDFDAPGTLSSRCPELHFC